VTLEKTKVLVDALDVAAKIVIAIIAGVWVLYTYPEAREKEFRKSYWDHQMDYFFEATQSASEIATLPKEDPNRDKAVKTFWTLYWGQMTVVEAKCEKCDPVDQAMIQFGYCLTNPGDKAPKNNCDFNELQQRAITLGKACRNLIGKSWDERLNSLGRDCPTDGRCP
jgi:hypothetical protein